MPTNQYEEEIREILKRLLKRLQDRRDSYAAKEKALLAQAKEAEACAFALDQALDEMRQEMRQRWGSLDA